MAKVLCVDDDESVARLVAEIVDFCGHEAVVVTDSMEAIQHLRDRKVKAIISDYMMPKLDGLDLLLVVQDQRPDVRRLLITAAPNEAPVKAALTTKLTQMVLPKPVSIADVKLALAWLD